MAILIFIEYVDSEHLERADMYLNHLLANVKPYSRTSPQRLVCCLKV
jgi:hypothetical protein